MYESDEEDMILLGYTGWINMDWSQGFFCDNFDGNWFCLPNGQLLSAYLVSEEDGYDIYYSPILLKYPIDLSSSVPTINPRSRSLLPHSQHVSGSSAQLWHAARLQDSGP